MLIVWKPEFLINSSFCISLCLETCKTTFKLLNLLFWESFGKGSWSDRRPLLQNVAFFHVQFYFWFHPVFMAALPNALFQHFVKSVWSQLQTRLWCCDTVFVTAGTCIINKLWINKYWTVLWICEQIAVTISSKFGNNVFVFAHSSSNNYRYYLT